MAIADTALRNIKASDKPFKLADGGGLYLLVKQIGKYWRMDYRFAGKRKTLAFGTYPDVSLKQARASRDDARQLLANGNDPGEVKREQKAATKAASANSFEAVARDWLKMKRGDWAASTATAALERLETNVFPVIGNRPIAEITPPVVLDVLRRIDARGANNTAHKVKSYIGQVCRYAVGLGVADRDPTPDLRGLLPVTKPQHFAALTDPQEVGALLRAMDAFEGTYQVQAALRLAPFLFVRPGELRKAQWEDVDLEAAEWVYHVSKTGVTHVVPLPRQAVEILRGLHPYTGNRRFIFPGARDPNRPMSESAINAALRRMGYDTQTQITGHGFRAMASTMLEQLGYDVRTIELQLSHKDTNAIRAAYKRDVSRLQIDQRARMVQAWADYLDGLKAGGQVIPFARRA